ncbi:hypothetical protein [Plantactinospora sp. CA-290183]|uniref:hypothetical protein n=1 Tax=Plantactinospora sp. CA-290183 TaxID=3240006 RepID=UPI003D8DD3E8
MELMTHELIPMHASLSLPNLVIDRLADLGIACNSVVDAIRFANLGERRAQGLIDLAESDRRNMTSTLGAAHELAISELAHMDHLFFRYAKYAGMYATYAVRVAAAVAAGRLPPDSDVMPVRPSDVIREPQVYVPLVRLGQEGTLVATHAAVMETLLGMTGETARFYRDDRARWPRPAGSVEVNHSFPKALHAYAAALAFAVSSHSTRCS